MSLGKHFINDIQDPVERGLKCLLKLDQSLRLIQLEKVLYRQQTRPKVLLLSGGGSGHEPAHAGYLGEGMLDICVAGQIFASPSASQVLAGLKALDAPHGVLMIVKNYTGDKLNFGLAAQKAKAEGIRLNVVFVGDDISVTGNDLVGRRGLAGVVFVHKIAGALAETGATLDEVTDLAQRVADNIFTIGVSLDRCSVPRRMEQQSLPAHNLEYGMGIHNEPGVRRDTIPSLSMIVTNILAFISSSSFKNDMTVAVMINNLGGLSVLEVNIIAGEVIEQLETLGLSVSRLLVGTFATSLDGPGFSVTILKLQPGFEQLLNTKTTASAWPNVQATNTGSVNREGEQTVQRKEQSTVTNMECLVSVEATLVQKLIMSIVKRVIIDEPLITRYDTIAGDGDCGETLLKGVNAIQESFSNPTSSTLDLIKTFHHISQIVEASMGGTSGALYAIFLNALANSLSNSAAEHPPTPPSSPPTFTLPTSTTSTNISVKSSATRSNIAYLLAASLTHALAELCRYTTARKGQKTLMDALIPFVETFEQSQDFKLSLKEAERGAEGTKRMDALLGRASYVGKEGLESVPDPGAVGVVSILRGIEAGLGIK